PVPPGRSRCNGNADHLAPGSRAMPHQIRDPERLLGMAERGLGLSLEVCEPGGEHVAPADRLDVSLLAGDLPPLLEQAACLLELAQFDEEPGVHPDPDRELRLPV